MTVVIPRSAIAGWVLFDWAAQPYFTLVTTFVYAPYFAGAVAADPVRGQALWDNATAAASLVIALLLAGLGRDCRRCRCAQAVDRRGSAPLLVAVRRRRSGFGKPNGPSLIPLVLLGLSRSAPSRSSSRPCSTTP